MSCLKCDRNGCDNIMCDRFCWQSEMYICNDCFCELVKYVNERGGVATDKMIRKFMDKKKEDAVVEKTDSYEQLDKLFPISER